MARGNKLAHQANLNFQSMLRFQAMWSTGSHIATQDGVLMVAGPSRFPGGPFNASMRTEQTPALQAVTVAMRQFAEFGSGFTMYVLDGVDTDLEAVCRERRFIHCGDLPVMSLSGLSRPSPAMSDLAISPVRTVEDVQRFAEICARAYLTHGVPAHVVMSVFSNPRAVLESPAELFLAKLQGKSVGCGLLLFDANAAGVYWISVLPDYRRRGYATELTWKLADFALAQGAVNITLQASPAAVSLYQRLGFHEVTRLRCYCYPKRPQQMLLDS